MLSTKVRNLSHWFATPPHDFLRSSQRLSMQKRFVQSSSAGNYSNVERFYEYPYLLEYSPDISISGMTTGKGVSEPFDYCVDEDMSSFNQFTHSPYWENPVIKLSFQRGSDVGDLGDGTITDNSLTVTKHSAKIDEQLHHTIKKMTKQTMPTTQDLTNDEKYVLAILRPNIMTSELYASNFIESNDISFRYNRIDSSKNVMLSNIQEWKTYYQDKFPGCTVSVEQGVFKESTILSVRFVVMSAERKLILVWLVASSTYSIHYKNADDIKGLLAYLETLHVPKKRTIKRCYNGGKDLSVNTVTIDGRYQVHDEFYPMVNTDELGGMNVLLDKFEQSTSNLLILAGQWGGGKSALFQAMCWRDQSEQSEYILVDDPTVYGEPGMFSKLINMIENNTREGAVTHLFLEEADSFIRDKRNNPFLSRLASLTAGAAPLLIKIVVATNDDSEAQIDSALTRGGRLFAMLKFGTLTPEQANTARAALNLEPRDFTENVTLAEALTQAAIITGVATTKKSRGTIGF